MREVYTVFYVIAVTVFLALIVAEIVNLYR